MPADLSHPAFPQPADPEIKLWRYMDLSKFVALLQTGCLAFVRVDLLGDPYEGTRPLANQDFDSAMLEEVRAGRGPEGWSHIPPDAMTSLFEHRREVLKSAIKYTYVSCWHFNEDESAAMWKLYSRSSDAVCIKVKYQTLANLLPDLSFMGHISYRDYKTEIVDEGNLFNVFMSKRRSFSHEREVRAIIVGDGDPFEGSSPSVMNVPVDLSRLVEAIYVSPEAADWFKGVVEGLALTYGLGVPVHHSELGAPPLT